MNEHVEHLIPDWLDDRLDADARERVRAHCAGCADCRAALEEGEAVWSLLGEVEAPRPSPVWPEVAESLRGREPVWLRWSYPVAAAAVLVLGVFLGGQFAGEPAEEPWLAGTEMVSGSALADDAAWSLDELVSGALAWTEEES